MAFRSRFEHNLRSLKEEFEEKIKKMREYNRDDFKKATTRLDDLEHSIEQEISDRMTETDATIGETQDKLNCKFLSSFISRKLPIFSKTFSFYRLSYLALLDSVALSNTVMISHSSIQFLYE